MVAPAPEGSQFDACQYDAKMTEFDGQDFFTSYNEVHESFDALGLQENLLRGIYAYGRVGIYSLNWWLSCTQCLSTNPHFLHLCKVGFRVSNIKSWTVLRECVSWTCRCHASELCFGRGFCFSSKFLFDVLLP
ncbi:hypothetical protein NE237_016302 [Protea cynaroides]|uniref:Uncharacterized protein n=1 Tax=Protea cynaroides TaxID=273540 RepID=A0A9Q0JSX6_9MAGN|nr:hypothetical protein NE237_016302 [Protea cynaroides]